MDEVKVENNEAVEETGAEVVSEAVEEAPKTEAELLREAEEIEKAKKAKIKAIWDKITTGILIALMASPIFILGYIFWWFAAGGF
ncbi:MAG: hypothetical protein IKC87_05160 [Clostridia bacterium]|nr:hypothetical protein [Clostridia bacterium]